MTKASTPSIGPTRHTRKPYRSVRLTQMKWKGIVSHGSHSAIATRFATANAPHASSSPVSLSLGKAVPRVADGLDRRGRPELLAQAPHTDFDDVRARVEVVAPDLGEETLAAHDLARVEREVVQEPELAVGQVGRPVLERGAAQLRREVGPRRENHHR